MLLTTSAAGGLPDAVYTEKHGLVDGFDACVQALIGGL